MLVLLYFLTLHMHWHLIFENYSRLLSWLTRPFSSHATVSRIRFKLFNIFKDFKVKLLHISRPYLRFHMDLGFKLVHVLLCVDHINQFLINIIVLINCHNTIYQVPMHLGPIWYWAFYIDQKRFTIIN